MTGGDTNDVGQRGCNSDKNLVIYAVIQRKGREGGRAGGREGER